MCVFAAVLTISGFVTALIGTDPVGSLEKTLRETADPAHHRQVRFTQRLFARSCNDDSQSGDRPEEMLARERSALPACLRAAAALRRREIVEARERGTSCRLPGRVVVEERA